MLNIKGLSRGRRCRVERTARGLRLIDLSRATGIGTGRLSEFENDLRSLDGDELQRIHKALSNPRPPKNWGSWLARREGLVAEAVTEQLKAGGTPPDHAAAVGAEVARHVRGKFEREVLELGKRRGRK